MKIVGFLFVMLGLVGCQKAAQTKPASAPIWFLESYDKNKGFTFSKNMIVDYVVTCESFRPAKVSFYEDEKGKVTLTSGDCTGLLPLVGSYESLAVTVKANHLLLTTSDGEYDFKIVAVHGTKSGTEPPG